jgi:hypothetical protein
VRKARAAGVGADGFTLRAARVVAIGIQKKLAPTGEKVLLRDLDHSMIFNHHHHHEA